MPLKVKDPEIERQVIVGLLQGPEQWKNIPSEWFTEDICIRTFKEANRFFEPPYNTFPTIPLLTDRVTDSDIKLFLSELATLKFDPREYSVYLTNLYKMFATRKVYEIGQRIVTSVEDRDPDTLVQDSVIGLTQIVNPISEGLIERGFIYEEALKRWNKFKTVEANPNAIERIPTYISEFDKIVNKGLRKPHIVLFYAATGGYKSRLLANLAYNFGFFGKKDVMVVTLEIPKEDYDIILDSRHSLLEFNRIVNGTLENDRDKYYFALNDISTKKPSVYVVDIPGKSTSADLVRELQLYHAKFGKYPDVVILDYVNEMEPISKWNNTSEKFKNLGVEIRRIARTYKILFITAMQENREGMKMKDKSKGDLTTIGESHYFSNVCHVVCHLYQDEIDIASNQLHISFEKNRYGPKKVSISVFANAEYNYIGDLQIRANSKD